MSLYLPPLRHEDHKSCQHDETKLLQPAAYAHIITNTHTHTPTHTHILNS